MDRPQRDGSLAPALLSGEGRARERLGQAGTAQETCFQQKEKLVYWIDVVVLLPVEVRGSRPLLGSRVYLGVRFAKRTTDAKQDGKGASLQGCQSNQSN